MRTWRTLLRALLALALLLAAAPAAASADPLVARWPLDEQTATAANDCPFSGPDSGNPSQCYYYRTPDVIHGYDVGPYYHTSMDFTSGRWGHARSGYNESASRNGYAAQRPATS